MSDSTLDYADTRLRQRIPLVIRVLVLGLLVTEAGLVPWTALLVAPSRPMGLVVVPVLLVLYWLFVSGRLFWPATKPMRRENFRAISLAPATWKGGLAAAGL